MLGTNPMAWAIPTLREPMFVLDFATTAIPRGKIEVCRRKGSPLRPGWALDAEGRATLDAEQALRGSLLPLGGAGTDNGGHKGYGLGLLVDILCGVLSGGLFGTQLTLPTSPPTARVISHFFAAFRIDGFREVSDFKSDVDRLLRSLKNSKSEGERIYVAGEREHEKTFLHRLVGIPIHRTVWRELERLADELKVARLTSGSSS